MTEQDAGYAASSLEQLLFSCRREKGLLRVPQAEAGMSDAFVTHRTKSPEDVRCRMRLSMNLHCALLIAEAGAPSHRVRFSVKVGDEEVRVRFHHPRELGGKTA